MLTLYFHFAIIFDMKIKEYIPSYFSGFDERISYFSTKDDLLKIDLIKCEADREGFSGYMVNSNYLMSTYNYNTNKIPSWYPIGFFDNEETANCVKKWFPHWDTHMIVLKNGDTIKNYALLGNIVKIGIINSHKCSYLISDYKKTTVSYKWFCENYSHNVFKMS